MFYNFHIDVSYKTDPDRKEKKDPCLKLKTHLQTYKHPLQFHLLSIRKSLKKLLK